MVIIMKTVSTAAARPYPPDRGDGLFPKVAVAYGDLAAGENAVHALAGMFPELADDPEFRPRLWRFDVLEDARGFSTALADASEADILVIATSSAAPLKPSVENWLRSWIEQKRGTEAAVAAVLGPAEHWDGPLSPRLQALQDAVWEAGLDFFGPPSRRAARLTGAEEGEQGADRPTPLWRTLQEFDGEAALAAAEACERFAPHGHWGLNE